MDNGKTAYEKFIDLDNKDFTDEDVFIRISYKDKKGEIMKNKKFEKMYERFIYRFLQFKRYFKYKFGLRMEYQIMLYDRDGNFVKGIKSR